MSMAMSSRSDIDGKGVDSSAMSSDVKGESSLASPPSVLETGSVPSGSFYAQHTGSKKTAETAPRRGGRARKPTQRSADAESAIFEEEEARSFSSSRKDKHGKKGAESAIGEATEVQSENEDDGDEQVYCICRGKDDGSFMISCERCEDWFHTRCIGLTQKEAKKLAEYICDSCAAKEKKPIQGSKTKAIRKYQGSAKSKHTRKSRDVSEAASEAASSEHAEASDDGDDYKSDAGPSDDEDNIDEDAEEYQDSFSRPRLYHAESSSRSVKRKGAHESPDQSPRKTRTVSGSDSLKRRASGSNEASIARRSSASHSKNTARKASAASDAVTEDARSRARKVLADALTKILSPPGSGTANKEKPNRTEDGVAYAHDLESTLFDLNADLQGRAKVVGTKYKDRFRTMLFSLKDAKNTTLHSRIASGDLSAIDLAQMTSDELANDVMRQATEKARMEALRNSTLKTESAGPMRKITHKGEIEIESETVAPRDEPGKFQRTIRAEAAPLIGMIDGNEDSNDDDVNTDARIGSEPARTSHADEGEPESESVTSNTRHSAPAPIGPSQSPTAQLDFNSVWGVSEHQDSELADDDMGVEAHDFEVDRTSETGGGLDDADDFIDSFLGGKLHDGAAKEKAELTPQRSTTPKTNPSAAAVHRFRQVMWNGLIDLPDEFAFHGHVKQIAGRDLARKPSIWSTFLPDKSVGVAGRLPSKAAIDYLVQIGNSSKAEVVVFTIEPGQDAAGVVENSESDSASFTGMMKYLKDADRWGALYVSPKVKGVLIKDLYLAPLYKDQAVPLWLDLAQADSLGADWQESRDRDMFLLVAVVVREALRRELSEGGAKRDRSTSSSIPPPPSAQPVASIDTVPSVAPSSNFGSDALQTLLRTLGKTASSATPPHSSTQSPPAFAGAIPPGPPPGPPPQHPPVNFNAHHEQYGMTMQQHVPQQAWQQPHYPPPYGTHTGAAPQQMPAEEYPGQYNPDYMQAANHTAGHSGQFRGRGQPFINRGRGSWARGRGW